MVIASYPVQPETDATPLDIREHSIGLISVIIGLGLAKLFSGFNRLMRRRQEIRWNALPLAWALIALLLVNNYWWGLYLGEVTETAASNADTFLLGLVLPILLYLICAAALPDVHALRGRNLLAAYFVESRYFFILIVLYILATALDTVVHAGAFHWNKNMWLRLVIIGTCTPLIWIRRPWLHWCATNVVMAIIAYALFQMTLR